MIKKTAILLLTLLILTGLGIAVYHYATIPREEGIAYLSPEKMELYSPLSTYASSFANYQREKPDELVDLPEAISDNLTNHTLFFELPVGKQRVFAIIHKPSDDTAMAWIDTNMDNCLSDEQALSGVPEKSGEGQFAWEYFDFGNIQLKGKDFTSVPFQFTCHQRGGYIQIHPISCMEGKIRLGHRVYQVAVVDGDYDGKFNSFYIPSENYQYCGCDTFYVADCGGVSLFSLAADEVGQSAPLGRYYKRGEQHFSISLSEDGQTLKMLPAKPVMGTLKIGNNRGLRTLTRLFSDAATQDVNFNDAIELPVGRYQMHYGRVTYTHEDGTNFESQANFCEDIHNGQFTITAGETVTFNPGPPFTVKSTITKSNYNNQEKLYINAGLVGNEGERYGLRISQNMPEPTLTILDENDTVIHTGQMEYG